MKVHSLGLRCHYKLVVLPFLLFSLSPVSLLALCLALLPADKVNFITQLEICSLWFTCSEYPGSSNKAEGIGPKLFLLTSEREYWKR